VESGHSEIKEHVKPILGPVIGLSVSVLFENVEMKVAWVLFLVCPLLAAAKDANLCNRYPPLLGFQIDKVRPSSPPGSLLPHSAKPSEIADWLRLSLISQYLGRWWQMEKTPTVSELPGKCWSSFYYRDVSNVNKLKMRMDYVTRL